MSVPGFFTNVPDYSLPHPPVPLRVILTTHLALARAFELLRTDPPAEFLLSAANEDEITRQLQWIMQNRLLRTKEVPGFDARRIKAIVRAPEVTNFDGRHPAKKPDLVLFLLNRESTAVLPSHDGIFAECKPIDRRHPIGSHYCGDDANPVIGGIRRFIDGDYAWAMQEGMMVGYTRGSRTIARDLTRALSSRKRHIRLGSPAPPVPVNGSRASQKSEALHSTVHKRSFAWPGRGAASEIRLFHSWHSCS